MCCGYILTSLYWKCVRFFYFQLPFIWTAWSKRMQYNSYLDSRSVFVVEFVMNSIWHYLSTLICCIYSLFNMMPLWHFIFSRYYIIIVVIVTNKSRYVLLDILNSLHPSCSHNIFQTVSQLYLHVFRVYATSVYLDGCHHEFRYKNTNSF